LRELEVTERPVQPAYKSRSAVLVLLRLFGDQRHQIFAREVAMCHEKQNEGKGDFGAVPKSMNNHRGPDRLLQEPPAAYRPFPNTNLAPEADLRLGACTRQRAEYLRLLHMAQRTHLFRSS